MGHASAVRFLDRQVPTSYTPSEARRLSTALSLAQAVVVVSKIAGQIKKIEENAKEKESAAAPVEPAPAAA